MSELTSTQQVPQQTGVPQRGSSPKGDSLRIDRPHASDAAETLPVETEPAAADVGRPGATELPSISLDDEFSSRQAYAGGLWFTLESFLSPSLGGVLVSFTLHAFLFSVLGLVLLSSLKFEEDISLVATIDEQRSPEPELIDSLVSSKPSAIEKESTEDIGWEHGLPSSQVGSVAMNSRPVNPLLISKAATSGSGRGRTGDIWSMFPSLGKQKGPMVRFFGSVAYGNQFVFILDVSGSMNEGTRYRRAVTELLKTLDQLNREQQFLVILFSDQTRTMFDIPLEHAELLTASPEKHRRLETWLYSVWPEGWTNPSDALHKAILLKPSAIFLLSDGEFKKGPRKEDRLSGFVLRFVKRLNMNSVPIHTIAYEDPINRLTLQQLAEQSGGSYRYVEPLDSRHKAQK